MRLVLPGDGDIADAALGERGQRTARAGVEYGHVLVELVHELTRAGIVGARLLFGPGPGGEIVPARAAGRLWIRRDDFHVVANEVAPVVNLLRVAGAHEEHDGGDVRRAVVRQALLPVERQQFSLGGDFVDVTRECESDYVCGQPIDDRARLAAGTAM